MVADGNRKGSRVFSECSVYGSCRESILQGNKLRHDRTNHKRSSSLLRVDEMKCAVIEGVCMYLFASGEP